MTPTDPVDQALAGDPQALEELVLGVQDRIYNLALRLLWHPEDARDATQEILIRIVTHLGQFERRSAFSTWAYQIACNYLLTTRKRRAELEEVTFDLFAQALAAPSLPPPPVPEPERALLEQEVQIGCTHAMLLCLDREHRLAFILGEIVALPGDEAARVLKIPPATYRKRLSRARERMDAFLSRHCGEANASATCRCASRIGIAIARGRVDPKALLFAGHEQIPSQQELSSATKALNELDAAAQVYRSNPRLAAPKGVVESLRLLLDSKRLQILQ